MSKMKTHFIDSLNNKHSTEGMQQLDIHELDDINNMGDLYQKMIETLGKRFYNKHHKYNRD